MNCLFKVKTKATKKIVCVYDVKYHRFCEFLVYVNGEWKYMPVQLFEPIEKGGAE
jgi:hypothetical protein